MSDYTKDNISALLFEKIDSILIVDAAKDTYQAIKKTGLFETFLEPEGSYKILVEKLWFHFNDKKEKIDGVICDRPASREDGGKCIVYEEMPALGN